ncbi:Sulfotransferase domain protein [Salinivirga cyanobacteriivorans]|uniref:Sulfotransferase domain protein n=1 Tax=Salinivirga cyanobacteriivorans TaxID=1307839 RepID=A0A0S2HVZ2_9BACT|nr:sulfotransferase domain-containing protein [Salinivirga cyanobacteriivorans]ALO14231.1 Sulfotransferase domain protein [Salinivirga cyanobacteriivorans]
MNLSFKNVLLVNGTPRSGTTWLGQIIDSSPHVRYKYQPLFSNTFKERITLQSSENEVNHFFEEVYNTKDDFLDREKEKKHNIHQRFEQKNTSPDVLSIKHVRYHYLLPYLLKQIDNLKVCAIIRNPCATLNSWRKAPKEFREVDGNFNEQWYFAQQRDRFKPGEYFGFHKWKEAVMIFLTIKKWYPERVHLLQYESLVHKTMEEVKRLFDFAELKITDQTNDFLKRTLNEHNDDTYSVFKGKKQTEDWKQELDPSIIEQIYRELKETPLEVFLK